MSDKVGCDVKGLLVFQRNGEPILTGWLAHVSHLFAVWCLCCGICVTFVSIVLEFNQLF